MGVLERILLKLNADRQAPLHQNKFLIQRVFAALDRYRKAIAIYEGSRMYSTGL